MDTIDFLSFLRQEDRHPNFLQRVISGTLDFDKTYSFNDRTMPISRIMISLLKLEMECILLHTSLDSLRRFKSEIENAEASIDDEHEIQKFNAIFRNPAIVIPGILLNALSGNSSFVHVVDDLKESMEWHLWLKMEMLPYADEDEFCSKGGLEASIRAFPGVLDEMERLFEIVASSSRMTCFVPLIVQLGQEYRKVDLPGLIRSSFRPCAMCFEDSLETVIDELRRNDIVFKVDIESSGLIEQILGGFRCWCSRRRFRDSLFRYVVNWDRESLRREVSIGDRILPLHRSVMNFGEEQIAFPTVLQLDFQHFPDKLGFLYHTNNEGVTPFALACKKYGKEKAMRVINNVLPMIDGNTRKKLELFISLAVDYSVYCEGIYTILRRDPSVLLSVLPNAGANSRQTGKRYKRLSAGKHTTKRRR